MQTTLRERGFSTQNGMIYNMYVFRFDKIPAHSKLSVARIEGGAALVVPETRRGSDKNT